MPVISSSSVKTIVSILLIFAALAATFVASTQTLDMFDECAVETAHYKNYPSHGKALKECLGSFLYNAAKLYSFVGGPTVPDEQPPFVADKFIVKDAATKDSSESTNKFVVQEQNLSVPVESVDIPTQAFKLPSVSLPKFPSTSGMPLMLGDSGHVLWVEGMIAQRWDPGSGELKSKFELPHFPAAAVETSQGIVLVGSGFVMLVAVDNKVYSARLTMDRFDQRIVALADNSVLILDGYVSMDKDKKKERTSTVERVVFDTDKLTVERVPDLPGPVRTSYGTVALNDGRVMVLGGNTSPYTGCSCTAETWIFNPKNKAWVAGPKMNEPRAYMSATLLPDGSVLVAGGFTSEHGWGGAGSRTVERWNPQANSFTPLATRMISYMSMHRALWLPGAEGKLLVLAGGNSAAIQVYNVERDAWYLAGENCQGTENKGRRPIIPLLLDKKYWLIVQNEDFCYASEKGSWGLRQLRLPLETVDIKHTANSFSGENGVVLYRSGIAFLPGVNDGPSLALGGQIHAGTNTYVITSASDMFLPDGHIQSLPGFVHARRDARLFRLADASLLLVGGKTDVEGYDHAHENASYAEWLPGNSPLQKARWQPIELGLEQDTLGQSSDGSLIAVSDSGAIKRIKINVDAAGKPHVQPSELPSLPNPRLIHENNTLVVRGLPDGRIVVAGGSIKRERIAVMQEDSMDPKAKDTYLDIGAPESTNDYDIYEPATGKWRSSKASKAKGGLLAIYSDGRVVRLSEESDQVKIEISSTDGKSWKEMETKGQLKFNYNSESKLFVLQDELFVAGKEVNSEQHTETEALQWFNEGTRQWETVWQSTAEQNWRDNVGRIIIRQLANGKRILVPTEGL